MHPSVHIVDVFGSGAFSGNPVAVVSGAHGLDADEMQRITRWFNLSETTFLQEPTVAGADYRVRIFTLDRELPFAGHPTLGTAHVWRALSGSTDPEIAQECGAGLVPVRCADDGMLSFAAPPLVRSGAATRADVERAARMLGIGVEEVVDAAWVDNGPGWLGIRLASADDVLALTPAGNWPERIDVGVVGAYGRDEEAAVEVRAFFTDHRGNVLEDPVTGSLNASVAQWLYASDVVDGPYIASQGTRLGRRGRVSVSRDATGQVWIGGRTRTQVAGTLTV